MITNTGKSIIAKYLVGQTPVYASYMAIGCGSVPLASSSPQIDYSAKETMDFEMFRVPITSRGYVTEMIDGEKVSKVVLTAELPTEQRYLVSEVGLYSAKSNPSATNRDSRVIYSFTETEDWEYHDSTGSGSVGATITAPLNGIANDNIIDPTSPYVNATYPVFRASSDNDIFNNDARTERYEQCRFLNGVIMLPGDLSLLESTNGAVNVKNRATAYSTNGTHIHIQNTTLDLTRQSSDDELRLAFSVINKDGAEVTDPTRVLMLVEFSSDDSAATGTYARFSIDSDDIAGFSPATNRYYVSTKKLSQLEKSADFNWGSVKNIKIFASTFETVDDVDVLSDKFYVCLDALKLENVSTQNPLYGLVGYTAIRSTNSQPVLKESNTSNSVEFRYGLDVI